MKLTDAQRFELFSDAFRSIIARPGAWPTRAPNKQDGSAGKEVGPWFGVAVNAAKLARDAAWVLEHEDDGRDTPLEESAPLHGDSGRGTPF